MPYFSLLLYLLAATVLCTLLNGFLFLKTKRSSSFDRVLVFANLYLGLHAAHVFLVRAVFYQYLYLDRLAPFALLYGPILFFALTVVLHGKIASRKLLYHLIIPVLFWVSFFAVLIIGVDGSARKIYGYALTIGVFTSMFAYTAYGFYCNAQLTGRLKKYKPMIIPALVLMLFMCSICLVVPFYSSRLASSGPAKELLSMLVYSLMLSTSLLILRYRWYILQKEKRQTAPKIDHSEAYKHSALSESQLQYYADRLEQLMRSEQPFLTSGLSLASLAAILRIPPHHLTQVFSLAVGKTFSQYINAKRVVYACHLLTQEKEMKLQEVALKSGFGTMISFHRQFKATMGCTPSEYKKKSAI